MTLSLTSEQREAVEEVGNALIDACPGSGKTRAVIGRLLKCLSEVEGTSRQVACITYTNAGVDEVYSRVKKQFGRSDIENFIELRTIHAFCLSKILRPYFWLRKDLRADFQVLASDDVRCREIVADVAKRHKLNSKQAAQFEFLRRSSTLPEGISQSAASDYWKELKQQNLVDFDGVVHFSNLLCAHNSFISCGLASNFKYFVVDEFQDTTNDQLEVLKRIASHGLSTFFFVGDPHQSIMRFAGARPDAMDSFASCLSSAKKHHFTSNFRSSSVIVSSAQKLLPRTGGMVSAGKYKDVNVPPEWWHVSDLGTAINEKFLPRLLELKISLSETAILAPNFYILADLARSLRANDIPVVGFGSRPYKRANHIIAPLFEELGQQISNGQRNRFGIAQIRLAELVDFCGGYGRALAGSFHGRVLLTKVYLAFREGYLKVISGEEFLNVIKKVLLSELAAENILDSKGLDVLGTAIDEFISEIREQCNKAKIEFHVANIGLFGSNEESLRMMTIHRSKGREFEAVAVVMPHEGFIPFGKNVPKNSGDEADGQRLMYVAVTRAKRVLMFFTDSGDFREHSRYLDWMKLRKESH